jgi:hypothetical protein
MTLVGQGEILISALVPRASTMNTHHHAAAPLPYLSSLVKGMAPKFSQYTTNWNWIQVRGCD